jgi:hypothetical protein
MKAHTVKWYIARAEHLKALEQTDVYLHGDDERPWGIVSEIELGGTWRYGICTSMTFRAAHPCGIVFRWCEDMEPPRANGASSLQFDIGKLRGIAARLIGPMRAEFGRQLEAAADAMGAQAADFQSTANRLLATRDELRKIGGAR